MGLNQHHLRISGSGPKVEYAFRVTGSVRKSTADEASINTNDVIVADEGSGAHVTGDVLGGTDAFDYTGTLIEWQCTAPNAVTVTVDGSAISLPEAVDGIDRSPSNESGPASGPTDSDPDTSRTPSRTAIDINNEKYTVTERLWSQTDADRVISSTAEFRDAGIGGSDEATPGTVLFIEEQDGPTVVLDDAPGDHVRFNDGVKLVSNRENGTGGGHIYSPVEADQDEYLDRAILFDGGGTVAGVRLEGFYTDYHRDCVHCPWFDRHIRSGIEFRDGETDAEVYNAELWGWPRAAVQCGERVNSNSARTVVHHCYIHDCAMSGYGYGIQFMAKPGLAYRNRIEKGRHAIVNYSGTYAAIENSFGDFTSHVIDSHGACDVDLVRNTVATTKRFDTGYKNQMLGFRDRDAVVRATDNWFYQPLSVFGKSYYEQDGANIAWDGNEWGQDEPAATVGVPRDATTGYL